MFLGLIANLATRRKSLKKQLSCSTSIHFDICPFVWCLMDQWLLTFITLVVKRRNPKSARHKEVIFQKL
jgi:hypothetical protein